MNIPVCIYTKDRFLLQCVLHGYDSSARLNYQPQSQDRTLTVQYKAPIRSQTLGPVTLGEHQYWPTGQCKGNYANPSTGQANTMFIRIVD